MGIATTDFPGALDSKDSLVWAANNASTTLATTINDTDTSIVLTSAAAFPASGIIRIDDELIAYSSKATNTLTVQASPTGRGFESTTAASHTSGATVRLIISAASHNVQSDAIIATQTKIGTGASTPAANVVLTGSGTGTSAWGQVTNAMLAGSIQASKLVGTDIATVGTITSGTLSTGAVLGGVTVTLGSDATGDIYYRNSGGVLTRLGIGTTGQVLTVASGLPSWASVTASAGGTNTQLQYNSSNSLAGISGATSNGTSVTFSTGNLIATSPSITTSLTTGSASFDLINTTATTVNFAGAATTLNMAGGSGAVINLGGEANAAELRFLEPSGSGTNYTALKAQAQAANVTYTLPAADGTSGQVLSTNGSGTLSWATASGGGGGTPGGSSGQVQYNDSSAFNGSALFTFSPTVSPNVVITANAAGSTALRVVAASSPTASIFQVTGNVTTTVHFAVTSSGAPTAPGATNSERFGAGSVVSSGSTGQGNTAIGANAACSTTNDDNTMVGAGSGSSGNNNSCTGVGRFAAAGISGNTGITAVGAQAGRFCRGEGGTFIGFAAGQGFNSGNPVTGGSNTAIGNRAGYSLTSGTNNVYVGHRSGDPSNASFLVTGSNNTALGYFTNTSTGCAALSSTIAIGANASATASNQCVIGGANANGQINDMYVGSGVTFATPVNVTINASGGSGTNIAGADLSLAGGRGTGSGNPGVIGLRFARPGSSGSALNSLTDEWVASYSATDTLRLAANIRTSTTSFTEAAAITAAWTTATHASRTSVLDFWDVYNGGSLARAARITEGRFSIMSAADANPTTTELSSLSAVSLYVKSNKFIIAYNNGGNMTYITIPLDGSTTAWSNSTTPIP